MKTLVVDAPPSGTDLILSRFVSLVLPMVLVPEPFTEGVQNWSLAGKATERHQKGKMSRMAHTYFRFESDTVTERALQPNTKSVENRPTLHAKNESL